LIIVYLTHNFLMIQDKIFLLHSSEKKGVYCNGLIYIINKTNSECFKIAKLK